MPVGTDIMTHSDLILRPDPSRTVVRPFELADPAAYNDPQRSRAQRITERVLGLSDDEVAIELRRITGSLSDVHRNVNHVLDRRYAEIVRQIDCEDVGPLRSRLIGAFFSEEYSFEAAALFNPSMSLLDDQSGAPAGGIRFVLSLRGIGEGHVSSVTFRVGSWDPVGGFHVDPPSKTAIGPRVERLDDRPITRITCGDSRDISESILFPVTETQSRGIEDMRLVRFIEDDGTVRHLGTYTAFDGTTARTELIEADGFRTFDMYAMTGRATESKGLALFPRKVNGRFVMLGREDGENLWLIMSDDLTHWEGGTKILEPTQSWEFVQIGNCGSPIEIDEGWLVLTHGVGSVRNYCIGACLLDRDDPTKVLGRMRLPLVHPSPKERAGYVPNVVYSCGGLVHERTLLLPYGVADSFTAFATTPVDLLLEQMR